MKGSVMVLIVAVLRCSPVLGLGCTAPPPVTALPDGATATGAAMVAAVNTMRAYDSAVKNYVSCMEATGGDEMAEDAALEQLRRIAEKFNNELRAFKAKNAS